MWAASEAIELHGGNGYIQDFVTPRLLRDAQVLPIWEGTTNVLTLDLLRAMTKEDALRHLLAEVDRVLAEPVPGMPAGLDERLRAERTAVEAAAARLLELPAGSRAVAARDFADRLARWYSAVLLLDAARREADADEAAYLLVVAEALANQYALGSDDPARWLGDVGRVRGFAGLIWRGAGVSR